MTYSANESLLSRFIKGTISVGLGSASVIGFGLLNMLVAVRYLPAEDYGSFVLLTVVASFLVELSAFGLNLSTPKFLADNDDDDLQRRIINTVLILRILIMAAVIVLAVLARSVLSDMFGSSVLLDLIEYLPPLLFLQAMTKLLRSILQGLFAFRIMGYVDLISSVSNFALIIVLVAILKQGIVGLVYARIIAIGLSCAFAYFAIPVQKKLEFDRAILRKLVKFGLPLQINYILTFVFLRIDTLIIATLMGPAEIAYYEIARKIPENLVMAYDAFRAVYYPFIARFTANGELKRATEVINHSLRWISFFTILGALIALLFGNEIVVLLFTEQYLPSVPAFILLMIALNLTLVDYTLGYSLVAAGDATRPMMINVAHTTINVLANLLLLPVFGIAGAALASITGFVATNPVYAWFLRRRELRVRVDYYLRPIAVFGVFALATLALDPDSVIEKAAIIGLFLLACVVFSVIVREDVMIVFREARAIIARYLGVWRSRRAEV